MKVPMLKRSIANQFRKAMKRRRERQRVQAIHEARKLKRCIVVIELPETAESFSRWYSQRHGLLRRSVSGSRNVRPDCSSLTGRRVIQKSGNGFPMTGSSA